MMGVVVVEIGGGGDGGVVEAAAALGGVPAVCLVPETCLGTIVMLTSSSHHYSIMTI